MVVGISLVELFLSDSHSLKDKRQAIKRIVERTKGKFNISMIEADQTNLWQRASIGFAVAGANADYVSSVVESVHNYIESMYIGKIIDTKTEIIHV